MPGPGRMLGDGVCVCVSTCECMCGDVWVCAVDGNDPE